MRVTWRPFGKQPRNIAALKNFAQHAGDHKKRKQIANDKLRCGTVPVLGSLGTGWQTRMNAVLKLVMTLRWTQEHGLRICYVLRCTVSPSNQPIEEHTHNCSAHTSGCYEKNAENTEWLAAW